MKCDHCKKKIDLGAEFTCSSCGAVVCVACRLPEATYLAWLDLRDAGLGDNPQHYLLEQARVALSDGADFGWPGFARLNFGTTPERLEAALQRLDDVLGNA